MEKINLTQIANRLGWSRQRLWFVVRQKKHVCYDEAVKIEKASGGAFKASALCTDYRAIARLLKKNL